MKDEGTGRVSVLPEERTTSGAASGGCGRFAVGAGCGGNKSEQRRMRLPAATIVRFGSGMVPVPALIEFDNERPEQAQSVRHFARAELPEVVAIGARAVEADGAGPVELEDNRDEDGAEGAAEIALLRETLR